MGSTSKQLFTLESPHGPGGVFFAWQRTSGGYLATTGYDQVGHRTVDAVFIFIDLVAKWT